MNVGFISLGCKKNLIDTEMMIGLFKNNNFTIVNDPKNSRHNCNKHLWIY